MTHLPTGLKGGTERFGACSFAEDNHSGQLWSKKQTKDSHSDPVTQYHREVEKYEKYHKKSRSFSNHTCSIIH